MWVYVLHFSNIKNTGCLIRQLKQIALQRNMDNEHAEEVCGVIASEINAVPSDVSVNCNEATEVDTSSGKAVEVNSAEVIDGNVVVSKTAEVEESNLMDTSEAIVKQSTDCTTKNTSDQLEDKSEVAGGWPVLPVNSVSVDEEDPSVSLENQCPYQQHPGEKPWPFPKHLENSFQASSGLSRASSDADFCTVESFDDSKIGGSVEGSDQCSRSQSPLSYVIQLNEDSECSLPSEAGTSNVGPTDFNRILIGQVNREAESIDESSGLDAVAKQSACSDRADSSDLLLEAEGGSTPSDAAHVKEEDSAQKAARTSRHRSRRVRKNKDKEEQGGDEDKSVQSSAKSRQRKKVSVVTEIAPPEK
jgi:hypothetical protein